MKSIEKAPEDVQKAMLKIVDCVACSGGGVSFTNLLGLINILSDQLNDPSQKDAARQLLDVIVLISRIVDFANNGPSKKTGNTSH